MAAISWIVFRPLVGVALLLAAAAILFGLRQLHRRLHPPTPAAVVAQGGA
ncbi:MAG TPA: hypothetical protein VHW60_04745 [Caulobacteraceae bacterium]|nr:hypothetical protein [Caulobacteraceae bacterium]